MRCCSLGIKAALSLTDQHPQLISPLRIKFFSQTLVVKTRKAADVQINNEICGMFFFFFKTSTILHDSNHRSAKSDNF